MKKSQETKSVNTTLEQVAGIFDHFSNKFENVKGYFPEKLAVCIYFCGHLLMLLFHEPWFDEAVAWLIARDSSLWEILFVAPHYEGHPSLWTLILVPFAKLGMPYEVSLNLVSLFFSGIAVVLFIYKAPFKRVLRLLMPFTYFMFYQYSVVSRPYCMVMLAFVLISISYSKKEEHPLRFISSLWFLCLTSAYGIIIAGGICITWVIEMFCNARNKSDTKNSDSGEYRGTFRIFFEDYILYKGKLWWLLLLLGYTLFIIFRIIPADDTFAILNAEQQSSTGFVLRLLYTLFGIFSDLFITNTYSYGVTLSVSGLGFLDILPSVIIGIIILTAILVRAKRDKMLLLFLIPYIMLSFSMAYLYMSRHHMGVVLLFILFFLWIDLEKKEKKNCKNSNKDTNISIYGLKKSITTIVVAIGIIIPLYWGISSTIIDIFVNYSTGREEYNYLKDNNLLGKNILAEWSEMPNTVGEKTSPITFSGVITELLPYLDKDYFLNSPSKAGYNYSEIHKVPSGEVTDDLIVKIKDQTFPDIIIGEPDYLRLYSLDSFNKTEYKCSFETSGGIIWKGVPELSKTKIYIR